MKNTLKYKKYTGSVHFSADDKVFHGRVIGIKDIISFEGTTVKKLEKDFKESVDFYLDLCKKRGKEPEKPFSGKFVVRLPSELHCDIALAAKKHKKSINMWVIDTFREAVDR
jgi:predicted HicB family RNase H-like nuclease